MWRTGLNFNPRAPIWPSSFPGADEAANTVEAHLLKRPSPVGSGFRLDPEPQNPLVCTSGTGIQSQRKIWRKYTGLTKSNE